MKASWLAKRSSDHNFRSRDYVSLLSHINSVE